MLSLQYKLCIPVATGVNETCSQSVPLTPGLHTLIDFATPLPDAQSLAFSTENGEPASSPIFCSFPKTSIVTRCGLGQTAFGGRPEIGDRLMATKLGAGLEK
jgi:hypothetical protein